MEIRGIDESEIEDMIDLQCQVFRPDGHERFRQYLSGDSSYRRDQTRVVVVQGRIVATLRIWDRNMRIGSCAVRMGGIGGVGTHPKFRKQGYASALMRETAEFMKSSGYHLGVLFSEVPCRFYGELGWACLPMTGFRMIRRRPVTPAQTGWQVQPFDEQRDLEQVVALYDSYNARQSGSIVRSRDHWETAPARIRNILPTLVARRGETLGGYLNYRIEETVATVLEVAYSQSEPSVFAALSSHLLQICESSGVEELCGEIPHRHPLIDRLVEDAAGDLSLTGNASMMLYLVNLPSLLQQLLPDLQSRLASSSVQLDPLSICIEVGQAKCVLTLDDSGRLSVTDENADAVDISMPASLFWRVLLGESSWSQMEPILHARGIRVATNVSAFLDILFPNQEVILWAPDHF